MSSLRGLAAVLVLAGASLVVPAPALADARTAPEPRYVRPEARRQTARVPEVRRPVPEQLRVETRAAVTRPGKGVVGGSVDVRRDAELLKEARRAARWAARELAASAGRREYFRVGVFEGMRLALDDTHLGRADFAAGERFARVEGEAALFGRGIGSDDAWTRGRVEAARQVEDQFRDLSVEPRFAPRFEMPRYDVPRFDLPEATLRGVFRDFPLAAFGPVGADFAPFLRDWSFNAARLRGCATHGEFYDAGWDDPTAAFGLWRASGRDGIWRRLRTEVERARFRRVFAIELDARLAHHFVEILEGAYRRGFDDGWAYGAFVREEWQWRRGVRQGFRLAASAAARTAFRGTYPAAYREGYGEAFAEWSDNPRPEIRRVGLRDGNDDGVFQPGETIRVELELVNYGGRSGRFPIRLDGGVLAAPAMAQVTLPARDVLRRGGALETSIGRHVASRTETRLRFSLAGEERRLPMEVRFPLQLVQQAVSTVRDNLAGSVQVRIGFENLSLVPRAGSVRLTTDSLPGFRREQRIAVVEQRSGDSMAFRLTGLDPLDLIAGDVTLRFTLESDGVVHDSLRHRLAGTARDLSSRDLPRLLIRQSQDPTVTPERITATRALLLERLQQDWRAAVRSSGNPYKWDHKRGGTSTALGDLVQLYRQERARVTRPEVFADLSTEVRALAGQLPGAHPFLRKYVRRLSAALP